MDISIIIVNWNTRELLAQCLRSVGENVRTFQPHATLGAGCSNPTLRSGQAVETFVVDNASTDGSATLVRERFPWVHLIENIENVGFARANNQAIQQAQGRYILLLNSDTIVKPGSISAMLQFCDQHLDIGVLGPELLNAQNQPQLSWAKFPSVWSELLGVHKRNKRPYTASTIDQHDIAYEVDWMAGACLLIRSTVVKQIGGMDEHFFLYSEETDWCLRIKKAGWQIVYFPQAQVVHFEGCSSGQDLPRTAWLLYHSKLLYARKHFGIWSYRFLRLGFVVMFVLKGILRFVRGRLPDAIARWKLAWNILTFRKLYD